MSVLTAYAQSAVNTALRIQTEIEKMEGSAAVSAKFSKSSRSRAKILSDSCELQELANRLYLLAYYRSGESLPEEMDPLTMRHRELGQSGTRGRSEPGLAPGMETPTQTSPS